MVCGEAIGGDCFRFHGSVFCGSPKRGVGWLGLSRGVGESGARISRERAGVSGVGAVGRGGPVGGGGSGFATGQSLPPLALARDVAGMLVDVSWVDHGAG